jgi:choline dehydrogenase-like flavoprotein
MSEPPPLDPGFLTPAQRRTLAAVCDTICPALEPPPGTPPGSPLAAYWRRAASDLDVAGWIERSLIGEISPAEVAQLRQALDTLEQPALCFATSGSAVPFSRRGPVARAALLRAWSASPLPLLRQAYQTLKRVAVFFFFAVPGTDGTNPNATVLGYPDPWQPPLYPAPPANPAHPMHTERITHDMTLEADVCVIGSGAGGGVVAALLAAVGRRVVVLEAGDAPAEATYGASELDGFQTLYSKRGLLTTDDGAVALLAGRTLGGGTTINWMTCFRPPTAVLEEWATASGVTSLRGPELQASLDAVERRLHIDLDESHLNPNNAALMTGARALGWHSDIQPRNALNCGDCGHCAFGCPWGAKQGTRRTYLQDAYDAGARIIPCATAERVLLDGGRVSGVEARIGPPGKRPWREGTPPIRLTVRAPRVVVAAGALESPAILLRSGLRHPALGRNLYLHPATAVIGRFAGDIAAWSGVLQAAHSDQFADLDGAGYGFKFETTPIYPGLAATSLPWESGAAFKRRMLSTKQVVSLLVLSRDHQAGRVVLDRWGNGRILYRLGRDEAAYLLRGCKEGARLLLAAGAEEANTLHARLTRIAAGGATGGPAWQPFDAAVDRQGAGPNRMMVFSAHQMGTCRMGCNPAASVVGGDGAVHGVPGLYVADGSIFPRSAGVNPMLTIMGLAHWIGTRLAADA